MSNATPIETATQDALDRLILALRTKYQEELDLLAEPGLDTTGPGDGDYYLVNFEPEEVDTNGDAVCFVSQNGDREPVDDPRGSGMGRHKMETAFRVAIDVMFRFGNPQKTTRNGQELTPRDIMVIRSLKFTGALIATVHKHGPGPAGNAVIHGIEYMADRPRLLFRDKFPVTGIASYEFRVIQQVSLPEPTFEI